MRTFGLQPRRIVKCIEIRVVSLRHSILPAWLSLMFGVKLFAIPHFEGMYPIRTATFGPLNMPRLINFIFIGEMFLSWF